MPIYVVDLQLSAKPLNLAVSVAIACINCSYYRIRNKKRRKKNYCRNISDYFWFLIMRDNDTYLHLIFKVNFFFIAFSTCHKYCVQRQQQQQQKNNGSQLVYGNNINLCGVITCNTPTFVVVGAVCLHAKGIGFLFGELVCLIFTFNKNNNDTTTKKLPTLLCIFKEMKATIVQKLIPCKALEPLSLLSLIFAFVWLNVISFLLSL